MTIQNLDLNYLKGIATRVIAEKQVQKVETQIVQPVTSSIINHSAKVAQGYIFVPSINLYVSKHRTLQGKNWFDCHKELQANGEKMPTIPEFIEFVKYLKTNPNGVKDASVGDIATILDDILTFRSPYRGEWLDADFKVRDKKLYLNYNHKFQPGKAESFSFELLEDCLMEDRQIDLDSWLNNPTKQGLPSADTINGNIMYLYPRDDNNCVGGFSTAASGFYLNCFREPIYYDLDLGVRAVRTSLEGIN